MIRTSAPTVVLGQRDPYAAEVYGEWLRADGLHVVSCAGPSAPRYSCYMLEAATSPNRWRLRATVSEILASARDRSLSSLAS